MDTKIINIVIRRLLVVIVSFAASMLLVAQSKSVLIYKGDVKLYERHVSNVDSVVFKTTLDTVSDIEGNVYRTVTFVIGGTKMTWIADNLKTAKLNDGTPIYNVVDENVKYENGTSSGNFRMTPAYCWHMNQPGNKHIYGALYNHLAIETAKLAPKGWHVATNAEWIQLENFLGSKAAYNYDGVAVSNGTALKVAKSMASQFTWSSVSSAAYQEIGNNPNANNNSGLGLVACGYRDGTVWGQTGVNGFYWTSTVTTPGSATTPGGANSRNITSGTIGFDPAAAPTATGIISQNKVNLIQLLFGVHCVKDATP